MKEGQGIFLQKMKGEFRQCKMEGHQLGRVVAGMELVCLQHPQAWKDLQCLASNQLGCNLKGLCQWKLHQRFNKLWELCMVLRDMRKLV